MIHSHPESGPASHSGRIVTTGHLPACRSTIIKPADSNAFKQRAVAPRPTWNFFIRGRPILTVSLRDTRDLNQIATPTAKALPGRDVARVSHRKGIGPARNSPWRRRVAVDRRRLLVSDKVLGSSYGDGKLYGVSYICIRQIDKTIR